MSDESGPVRFAFGESTGPRLFDEGAPDVPEQDALFVLWSIYRGRYRCACAIDASLIAVFV